MTSTPLQVGLASAQLEEFYHDEFVDTQVEHFGLICAMFAKDESSTVVDVGGGCGFFAAAIRDKLGLSTRVIDLDAASVERCKSLGIEAYQGNALQPPIFGDEAVVCFNLILHHLVANSSERTEQLQTNALSVWRDKSVFIFVNEYIYDSYVNELSGKLIYAITKSRLLSKIGSLISRVVPSLRANTFGVGVRFRAEREWRRLFIQNKWDVVAYKRGDEEGVSLARRLLLIRSCRRDSFVLRAKRKAPQVDIGEG